MALSVHTDALPGLSAQLRRAAEDSRRTKAHLARCDTGVLGGFLSSIIKPDFDEALNRQLWFLEHGGELIDSAAVAVDQSRDYYLETDADNAQQFDSKLPATAVQETPVHAPAGHAAYADLAAPQGRLQEPGDYAEDLTWQISIESDLTNLVSPVRALCEVIFGVDPVELIVGRLLCGDWKEFRRDADRFNNAAWACRDIADNLASAIKDGESDWTGNAAGSAFDYLTKLERAYRGAYEQNEYLYGKFADYAQGCFSLFDGLASMLTGWITQVLLAMASAEIAAATEGVPVLNLATDAFAAYRIWLVAQKAIFIYEAANKVVDLSKVFVGSISMVSGAFADVVGSSQSLPDHPCVTAV